MRHKFYFLIQQITWVVFLFLTLFAVKTFERALPDEIYVPFGEKADYRFGVPVSVTLKDDSEEVFYRLNGRRMPWRRPLFIPLPASCSAFSR